MKILVAGEQPFLEAVGQLCLNAGHDTTMVLVEDFHTAVETLDPQSEFKQVDVAVEFMHQSPSAKQNLLARLDQVLDKKTLLLSSALSSSATESAAQVSNPGRVVGFGLFPPIEEKGLVELSAALQTDHSALELAMAFWRGVGLEPVVVKDGPGLVRARTVCCLINEAASALMEGVAEAEDIDRAMMLGTNYPIGPLAWADLAGLDTVLGVMNGLFIEWGEDRYRPSPLLKRMVLAGQLGRKTGIGFYQYPEDQIE